MLCHAVSHRSFMSCLLSGHAQLTMSACTPFRFVLETKPCGAAGQQVLQQGCKAASAVREIAGQVYGRMVYDCRDKSIIYESLKAGEV